MRTQKGIKGKCNFCGRKKRLTKHSLKGNHKPPFILMCVECHQKRHGLHRWTKKEKIARNRK